MKDFRNRLSTRDQVAQQLLDAIMSGEIGPGERLIETKLAQQFGIGQSTLREGLQLLEHKGILTKYSNRGTFVTKLTERAVEEIYSVRSQLEPFAASEACTRMTEAQQLKLAESLEGMKRASMEINLKELMEHDQAFHRGVWRFSGNSRLEEVLDFVCAPLFAFYLVRFSYFRHPPSSTKEDFERDLEDHFRLLAALKTGDAQTSELVFRDIIGVFRSRHLRHIAEISGDEPRSKASVIDSVNL